SPADRRPDSRGDERPPVPMRHVSALDQGDPARVAHDGGRWTMSGDYPATGFPRREFLKAGGALLVGFAFAPRLEAQQPFGPGGQPGALVGPYQPNPDALDTWIAIHADNTATIYIGYVELGQGNSTALLQMAAEELDLDMSQVSTVRVETGKSPNQGGTNASASISRGGPRIRLAAADARQALLARASAQLGAPVERLTVSRGVVSVDGSPGESVTYGALIGDRRLDVPYTGKASVKDYRTHTIVG